MDGFGNAPLPEQWSWRRRAQRWLPSAISSNAYRAKERGVSGLPQGLIVRREARRTKLARYRRREGKEQVVVSNVDQLAILLAAAEPRYDRFLIDRYLIAAEKGELAPLLCINKIDLGDAEQIRADLRFYAEVLGIPVLLLSAQTGEGLEEFRSLLAGKATVLSGPSGVGKSTLTNLLVGEEVQRIGEISLKLGQGRHVTTMARMFRLPQGGYIVDTPGHSRSDHLGAHPGGAAGLLPRIR
jgi:ribosome biogenesis GTPase